MATRVWRGTSANIKQVNTITMAGTGDWVQGDTVTCTIDNIAFVVTVGTLVTDDQVAITVYQALSGTTLTDTAALVTIPVADGGASLIPQFAEFTATHVTSSGIVTLTSNGSSPAALAGKPFTITVTENTTGDETATGAVATTSTSQWHADQADNWSTNTVPGGSDTVIFDTGNIDVRWSLDLGAILVAQLTKYKAYTGNVGLARTNTDNSAKPYAEYRTPMYLTADGFTNADLEVGEGPGSQRFYLDAGTVQSAINVYGKGTRVENGLPCILFLGTHAANVVRNIAGDVGIAFYGGEVATVVTLVTGDGPASAASTICGSGCTLTTVTLNGGLQETNSAVTTANQNGGTWTHKLGTVTTANIYAGVHYPNGAATYTTLNLYGGTFDCSKGNASFVVTNTVQLYKGAKYLDPQGRSGNVVFKLNGCTFADVTIVLPFNKTFTPS